MGAGWYGAVFASHDGSRIAQWEQRFARLPFWLRPAKRLLSHLLPRYREFRRLMARQFADPRRIVVAMSRMVADDFQRYHGVRPEQIRLVYHGIDAARFAPQHCRPLRGPMRAELGLADDEAALLFVGHDFARKGLATAIRATAQLVRAGRPARLLVVGRDRRQPLYAMLAHACGVGRQVAFVPACDDPRPYYAAADALVLPTYYDPFGLVVLEAAGCGLPVLTTRQAGVSELMTDGLEGFVLPEPADCRLLAERLQTVLEPGGREAMGAAARQLAQRHTFARNCKDILAIYQELTAARRAAA
jgi:UDP-glucose:(heptosyl)LPS alpha-1,3-glucosyltransferase